LLKISKELQEQRAPSKEYFEEIEKKAISYEKEIEEFQKDIKEFSEAD